MIDKTYFHGSTTKNLTKLTKKITKINDSPDPAFGSAIYLTEDSRVADVYTKGSGSTYEVVLHGNFNLTISMNQSFKSQTVEAKEAILKLKKHFGFKGGLDFSSVSHIIHPLGMNQTPFNDFLLENSIWLLYGSLDPSVCSGLGDKGVQYAVLDESKIKLIKETSRPEIMGWS